MTRRLRDNQRLAPVITAVVNWGEEDWGRSRTLYDMLEFPKGMEEKLRPFVADYPFNLIHMSKLPEELMDALYALAGVQRYREVKNEVHKLVEKGEKVEVSFLIYPSSKKFIKLALDT